MDHHLDHALEEEFAGHGETIHKLKVQDPHFKALMEENHALWVRIRNMQSNVTPADDAVIERLEKERLARLDRIAEMIRQAEAGSSKQ